MVVVVVGFFVKVICNVILVVGSRAWVLSGIGDL